MKFRFKIPVHWTTTLLRSVAIVQTGIAKGGKTKGDAIKLPYLRVANVQDGHLDLRQIKFIEISIDKVERYRLFRGDVLLTEGGDYDKLERGTIWNDEISNCLHQNHVFVVRTDKSKLLPYYLASISSSHIGRTYFLSCSKQTTNLASINSSQLKQMPLHLPPLAEQERIAGILCKWDEGIEKLDNLVTAKKKLKKALCQQLLIGKKQFKEFKGQKWKTKKLQELLNYERPDKYIVENTDYIDNGYVPVLTANKSFILGFSNETNGVYNDTPVIIFDDFTTDSKYVDFPFKVKSSAIKILKKSNSETDLKYLFERMRLIRFPLGNHKRYYISEYQHLKIKVPELKEQQKIASVLNSADKEIELLSDELEALKNQKKGLMQKLLTGKIRVKV